jgi:hypothetical protein
VTVVADRYRLLVRLGQGGMGVVWRAHDELLRRDVAVKELHVRIGVDGDFQARQVLREARAAARLRHPGVVAVHDVIVHDGRPLIVMELVEGPSLAEVIRTEGPLPEQRVAEIGARVLAALSMAHEQGVVHRDVKPGNILLDGDRVVLTDFGIAATTSDTTLTETVLGSPEYLAPERINGEPATPASDLWSLGVTLCAALRGESPFQRSDTQATLAAVLTYEPPALPQAPRLWPVLDALLRKDPAERLTVTEAGAMLAAAAGIPAVPFDAATGPVIEPVTVRVEPSDTENGARSRMRRRLAVLGAVLVLVAASVVWLVLRPTGDVAGGSRTSTTPTVSAPPGFTGHRGDGFTVAVPSGWSKDVSDHDIFWVRDRHDPRTVLAFVEWWDDDQLGGAMGVLTGFEKGEFSMDFISNYQRIRLDEKAAPPGMSAAELEITYHVSADGELDLHELTRAVVTKDGRTYILTIAAQSDSPAAAEELWQANLPELTKILDSFHVTP